MISSAWRACSSARDGVAGAQMDLRERRDRLRRVVVASDLERDRERVLQTLDRLLGLAEQELEPTEVVQQPADVRAVGELLVLRLRPLGVGAREHPVAVALGEQRRLEVGLAERPRVVHRLGELERALDVLARGLEVALPAVAARAPREDVRAGAGRTEAPSARRARAPRRRARPRSRCSRAGSGRRRAGRATSARSTSENSRRLRPARGPRRAGREPALTSPVCASAPCLAVQRAHVQLDGAGAEHGRRGPCAYSASASSNRCSSSRASARARIASARARSSAETPLARNDASTPSRSASHSIVSAVGRVLPRSICEMYSLEKRSPASWAWVRPGGDAQLPQPLAEPGAASVPARAVRVDLARHGRAASHPGHTVSPNTSLGRNGPFRTSPKGA